MGRCKIGVDLGLLLPDDGCGVLDLAFICEEYGAARRCLVADMHVNGIGDLLLGWFEKLKLQRWQPGMRVAGCYTEVREEEE